MKCVKCGHNDESRGYQWPSAIVHAKKFCGTKMWKWCATVDGEHLDITCGVCGYTWAAPCADAVPA